MHRSEFVRELRSAFPEVESYLKGNRDGLHLEMSAFRRLTQDAIEANDELRVRRYFGFVAAAFQTGNRHLKNAVVVSFLEELDFDAEGGRRAFELLPEVLRTTWEDLYRWMEKLTISPDRSLRTWAEVKQKKSQGG